MLTLDTAWAAGLFEGEGSVCWLNMSTTNQRRVPNLGLSTTDEDVIRRFHSIVGVGFVYGPYSNSGVGDKPYWQ